MASIATGNGVLMDATHLRDLRGALLAQPRLRGRRFCDLYSSAVDEWIPGVFAHALRSAGVNDPEGIALVAVGGYGRRELCPGSDLDLILVHDNVKRIDAIADAIWYPIWDARMQIDHSVRTPRETFDVVDGDIKSALSFLSGRAVAGDTEFADRVIEGARERWTARPRVSLDRLHRTLLERWEHHGELAFLLEPDVKLSRGGLRDFEALQAAALAAPLIAPHLEDARLERAGDELLDVRVALHATTGRRGDRLLLEDQDAVARRLGYADADELLPGLAAAGRRIAWITDQAWRRIDSWIAGPKRAPEPRPIEPGIILRYDELDIDDTIDVGNDAAVALRIAAVSARTGIPLAPATLVRLENEARAPREPWPQETRDALIDFLGCGHAAVPLIEALDHIGVLGRYFREWPAVRSRPQRNAYHRFTVDRHLFEAAAESADLMRTVHRPDLLLVAAFLHDIGKGFPGDHTEAGVRLMADIARRMGFADDDVTTLSDLVRDHLLLAETATQRDLSDPATIERVATRVGTVEQLELLAALTRADSIATGHTSWSAWKSTLIDELVLRTRAFLSGDRHEPAFLVPTQEQRRLMADRHLKLIADGHRLTVVAPDRAGLLSIVAGALAVNGISVRAATGLSEDGMAVETYDVEFSGRVTPDWRKIEAEIARAVHDPDPLRERLRERARSGGLPIRPGAARPASPRVIFDNESTPRATLVEVRAPDGVGVLARTAGALTACGCDVSVVRALTLGREIVDTFYVTDGRPGSKITDPERCARIEFEILRELSGT